MKYYIFLFLCPLLLIMHSCEKDADVKLPPIQSKLVISSFISPYSRETVVKVTRTQPLYNNPNSNKSIPVNNATVIISSDAGSWNLTYLTQSQRYVLDSAHLKIKAGAWYHLSVSSPEGDFAEAYTTIPDLNSSFRGSITLNPNASANATLYTSWNDPAGSEDHYRLDLITNRIDSIWLFMKFEITDEGNDGQLIKKDWALPFTMSSTDTVVAKFSTLSKEFYTYYEKLDKVNPDNTGPFTEPTLIYSNVKGGLGIFAGFNQYEVRVFP